MAENQLFPVFDMPEIPDTEEAEETYRPSVYFDFYKGDFVRDGANRMTVASGRDAYIQWCLKVASTERLTCLAYSEDIGVELEDMEDLPDRESRESEIERTITEALLVHPATEYVTDFEFTHQGDETWCTFTVKGYPWDENEALTVKV